MFSIHTFCIASKTYFNPLILRNFLSLYETAAGIKWKEKRETGGIENVRKKVDEKGKEKEEDLKRYRGRKKERERKKAKEDLRKRLRRKRLVRRKMEE